MSNQELQNQSGENEEAGVDKRRRFIKGAGIAAPVALTLTSPSVFGALCLSEMMSGNTSLTGTGSCDLGFSARVWGNPNGKVGEQSTIEAWNAIGFSYGEKKKTKIFEAFSIGGNNDKEDEDSNKNDKEDNSDPYEKGTKFSEVFHGNSDQRSLREILGKGNRADKNLVAVMCNAKYFKNYILTPDQVIGLCNGAIPSPSGYNNCNDFFESILPQ